jgi:hypothetical protein
MKINWHKNPLKTTIQLEDHDKEVFRLKVKIYEMEEAVCDAAFHLDNVSEPDYYDPGKAFNELKRVIPSDDPDHDFSASRYQSMLNELETGFHCGDCTCVPASCYRCLAESVLGIDTIDGLRKHAAARVNGAFGKDGERSLDEAIASLTDYEPVREGHWLNVSHVEFDRHVPAWRLQAKTAHEWLMRYRDEHFAETTLQLT